MRTHKDLDVWRAAVALAGRVYRVTASYPEGEKFGLVSQMRRAAVSIASNIAEGAARQTRKEFAQFLSVAAGSASELDTQVEISKSTGTGDAQALGQLQEDLARVAQMIQGLIRSLRKPPCKPERQ